MRFESVTAHHFGPLRNRTLNFSQGDECHLRPKRGWQVLVARCALCRTLRDAQGERPAAEGRPGVCEAP